MENQLYICDCHSSDHQMIWRKSPEEEEKIIYVNIYLKKYPFWERLKYGIKYILGYQCRYGAFDEILLSKEHVENLKKAIDYLEDKQNECLEL
jgi:hypothetical protein